MGSLPNPSHFQRMIHTFHTKAHSPVLHCDSQAPPHLPTLFSIVPSNQITHFHGSVFYACTVWFDKIKTLFKTKLNSMHFRMLWVACRYFNNQISKEKLMFWCKRLLHFNGSYFLHHLKSLRLQEIMNPLTYTIH